MSCHDWLDHARTCPDWYTYSTPSAPSVLDTWLAIMGWMFLAALALAVVVAVIAAGVYIGELLNNHHWCAECERTSRLRDAVEAEPLSAEEYLEATS